MAFRDLPVSRRISLVTQATLIHEWENSRATNLARNVLSPGFWDSTFFRGRKSIKNRYRFCTIWLVGLEEEIIDKDFRQSYWLALQFVRTMKRSSEEASRSKIDKGFVQSHWSTRKKKFTQSYWLALQFWVQQNLIFTVGVPQVSHGNKNTFILNL